MRKKSFKSTAQLLPSTNLLVLLLLKCAWGLLRKLRAKKKAAKRLPLKRGTRALFSTSKDFAYEHRPPPHFDF